MARAGVRVVSIFLLFILTVSAQAVPGGRETEQISAFVDQLMQQQRYREAAAYLQDILRRPVISELPASLKLSLVEAYTKAGEPSKAQHALDRILPATLDDKAAERYATLRSRVESLSAAQTGSRGEAPPRSQPVEEPQHNPVLEFPVTNSFFEIDVRSVLTDLSYETGMPILWGPNVEGLVTFEADEQPLGQVLNAVLSPLGFAYNIQDGAVYVGTASPEDPAFALLSVTEVVTLANLEAEVALDLLSEHFLPYVKASNKTNTVVITAPRNITDRIHADLLAMDRPTNQIGIEVIVAEVSASGLQKIGVNWTLSNTTSSTEWSVGTNHSEVENPPLLGTYTETGTDFLGVDADAVVNLEALVEAGDASIRANPRIVTMNGRPAELSLTKDQYFIIQTGSSQQFQYNTLQSVSSGIKLEITPYTSPDNRVTVHVSVQVGDVVGSGSQDLPIISNRSAATSVRLENGETFTIGGLKLENLKNIKRKIPLLGDIPLLGYLFRYTENETSESEVVIFITPWIVE